jgi:hypothetical protein
VPGQQMAGMPVVRMVWGAPSHFGEPGAARRRPGGMAGGAGIWGVLAKQPPAAGAALRLRLRW